MACTLLSVGSLIVLVLTSFSTNMKTDQSVSSTNQIEELQTNSMLSTVNVNTPEPSSGVTGDTIETNQTQQNASGNDNKNVTSLEKSNCPYITNTSELTNNCSTYTTPPLNEKGPTYRDFKEYEYYKNVYSIFPYAANIPGMITNFLTVITAIQIKPKQTSELYMIALGIVDFITVVTRCTYQVWLTNVDVKNSAGCKVTQYILHVSLVYSNFILISWTIERLIAVMFPLKLTTWCSVRNTKITLLMVLLLCLMLGIPFLTEVDAYSYWTGKAIVTVCFQTDFLNTVWTHTVNVYYIYIPVVCVCLCNIAILRRISAMTKARIQMASNQETIDKKARENKRMTVLLLMISGCFLVLHIPYAVILVFYYIYPDPTILISEDPHFFAKFIFYTHVGYLITEYQNSVNFFLYCLSGSKFRSLFQKTFCKNKVFMKNKKAETSRSYDTRSTNF